MFPHNLRRASVSRRLLPTLSVLLLSALLVVSGLAASGLAAQEPPPPEPRENPIPTGPPPKYEIEADPEALRQAAEEAEREKAAGETPQAVQRVQARLVGDPANPAILSIERFGPGARPEISRQGDLVAYDRLGEGGVRALYTSRLDGTHERCLTCSLPELQKHHAMAPTWHPRGDLLVAVGQGSAERLNHDESDLAGPARGLHAELWAVSSDGRFGWQLTRSASRGRAVGDPSFSHEGGLLAWSEREESEPGPWGKWVVQVGELKISGGVPRLGKVDTFDVSPFGRYVHAAGFTPDDKGLLLAVTRADGSRAIGRYDLAAKRFELLSPQNEDVALIAELPRSQWSLWIEGGEVWLVSASGRGRQRLTTFGEPASRYHLGQADPRDLAAGPDGKTLLVDLFESSGGRPKAQSLYLIRFDLDRLGRAR